MTEIEGELAALARLVEADPAQRAQLPGIEALVRAKLGELDRTIALARAGDPGAALATVRTGEGRARMDELRAALARFTAEERRLLDRRRDAFETAERAAQLRAIYDSAPEGLAFVDRTLRYAAINERLADINGRPVEAHLGRTIWEAAPEVAPMVEPLYRRVLEVGEPVRDAEGAVMGVNIAVLDITERKAAEAALARSEAALRQLNATLEAQVAERTVALSEANAQLDAFAYTVSHDLRAPLRAMEGFARILLDDFTAALGPKGGRYAARIVADAGRMEQLIDDLPTFSPLQRAEVAPRRVDPAPVAARCAEEARAASASTGTAHVEVRLPLPLVIAEPAVLHQVLSNLIGNAVKFHAPGRPAQVAVRAERGDGTVRLWVEDACVVLSDGDAAVAYLAGNGLMPTVCAIPCRRWYCSTSSCRGVPGSRCSGSSATRTRPSIRRWSCSPRRTRTRTSAMPTGSARTRTW